MVALNAVHQNFHDADIDYVRTYWPYPEFHSPFKYKDKRK